MSKSIKTVKTRSQLQSLLSNINEGRELLSEWIDLDPIFVGEKTKANYLESIHKQLVFFLEWGLEPSI